MSDYNIIIKILNDDLIKQVYFSNKKRLNRENTLNNNDIIKKLNMKYDFNISSYSELKFLKNNINNLNNLHIFCLNCGKKNRFIKYCKGYGKYCSVKCAHESELVKEQTRNKWKNKNTQEKDKIINRRKNTCIKKYGYSNPMKSLIVKEKCIESNKKNHGGKHNWASKDPKLNGRATIKKLYGVNNAFQIFYVKDRLMNTFNNKIKQAKRIKKIKETKLKNHGNENWCNTEKIKRTMLKNWGVDNYTKSQDYKNLYKNKEFVRKKINKSYDTKKKNNSFHISKPEFDIYQKLLNKFSDTIHHYKDNRYPFECDFYIPSKDLFIELNFHWTHGKEPFDKNNKNHLKILEKWKLKNSKFYKTAEEVWTIRDPLKLKTFLDNKLNFKIFYTKEDFENWFN